MSEPHDLIKRLADELRETIDAWCLAESDGSKIADHQRGEYCGDRCMECAQKRLLDEAEEWIER